MSRTEPPKKTVWFGVVAEPHECDHAVQGRSRTTVCGRAIGDRWLTARGIFDADSFTAMRDACPACSGAILSARAASSSESVRTLATAVSTARHALANDPLMGPTRAFDALDAVLNAAEAVVAAAPVASVPDETAWLIVKWEAGEMWYYTGNPAAHLTWSADVNTAQRYASENEASTARANGLMGVGFEASRVEEHMWIDIPRPAPAARVPAEQEAASEDMLALEKRLWDAHGAVVEASFDCGSWDSDDACSPGYFLMSARKPSLAEKRLQRQVARLTSELHAMTERATIAEDAAHREAVRLDWIERNAAHELKIITEDGQYGITRWWRRYISFHSWIGSSLRKAIDAAIESERSS